MCVFVFFNDTATTEIYTLSLHDALPILDVARIETPEALRYDFRITHVVMARCCCTLVVLIGSRSTPPSRADRKSTRLNSSHANISYAVFCLKKKIRATAQ